MFIFEPGLTCCLFFLIGLKGFDFDFQRISNSKRLFSEPLSPNKYGQLCLDIKVSQDLLLFYFLHLHLTFPQLINQVNKYILHPQSYVRVFQKFTVIILCFIPENS